MLRSMLKALWSRTRSPSGEAGGSAIALELLGQGRLREAAEALRRVCAAQPNDAEAWHLLGHLLDRDGHTREAIDALERATALAPENADAHFNLATAYRAAGHRGLALESFARAASLRPQWHAPWLSLGDLYWSDDFDRAEDMYRRALAVGPEVAETHYNFGNFLMRCGLADEALVHYREVLAIQPSFAGAYSNYLCTLNYSGSESPERVRDAHFEFDARYAKALAQKRAPPRIRGRDGRIRVGYVSPDFHNHAVGRLVEPALKHHDRAKFAVYCYSDVKQPDERTARFRSYAAVWRDITSQDDDAVAAVIRDDGIDILVDLTGHTSGHRLFVFARKPAPVQVTWIGYPNTTGMSAMDYRITDAYADPPGLTEHLHSERLLRMPDIYLPCEAPEERTAPSPPPCSARGYVTFGSFNSLVKVSRRTIALWARVLDALPASRLVLITVPEGRTRERLREAFAKHGIAADRLDLRGLLPHAEFLQAHADVDIALDPFPYHGTTTTIHTLWMGVPLVTLAGTTHVSRVGVSMLNNVGLSDLVATTEEDYVERAVALAGDVPRMTHLRATLRESVAQGPIMDGPRFTRALETLYVDIWEAYCRSAAPAPAHSASPPAHDAAGDQSS